MGNRSSREGKPTIYFGEVGRPGAHARSLRARMLVMSVQVDASPDKTFTILMKVNLRCFEDRFELNWAQLLFKEGWMFTEVCDTCDGG